MRFKLSQEGNKTNILKEKPKVVYSVALVLAFLSAENENRQLEDLPLADFGFFRGEIDHPPGFSWFLPRKSLQNR